MSRNKMWIATREYGTWIKCPAPGADVSRVGWTSTTQYLNGGAYVRNSSTAHRVYNWSWNIASRAELAPLDGFASGIYGDGPIYFYDPTVMDYNVLPEYWAAPSMAISDAPPLLIGATPTSIAVPPNGNGLPVTGARYITGSATSQTLYLPIPADTDLHIGFYGLATGSSAVRVTPVISGNTTDTPIDLTLLTESSTARMNETVSSASYTGALISITGTGTIDLYGGIAQILPTGHATIPGGWIPGDGHSGCRFASRPEETVYSSVRDQIGKSATLIEVGAWEQG